LISWKTKKQTIVSRSSAEAELRALACVTAEVTWLQWLLADFGVALSSSTSVHCDITNAISIAQDPVKHELTKHVGVDCFYVQSTIQDKIIALQYVPSLEDSACRLTHQGPYSSSTLFSSFQTQCASSTLNLKGGVSNMYMSSYLPLVQGPHCNVHLYVFGLGPFNTLCSSLILTQTTYA
jgi:hypothetical protein